MIYKQCSGFNGDITDVKTGYGVSPSRISRADVQHTVKFSTREVKVLWVSSCAPTHSAGMQAAASYSSSSSSSSSSTTNIHVILTSPPPSTTHCLNCRVAQPIYCKYMPVFFKKYKSIFLNQIQADEAACKT